MFLWQQGCSNKSLLSLFRIDLSTRGEQVVHPRPPNTDGTTNHRAWNTPCRIAQLVIQTLYKGLRQLRVKSDILKEGPRAEINNRFILGNYGQLPAQYNPCPVSLGHHRPSLALSFRLLNLIATRNWPKCLYSSVLTNIISLSIKRW